MLCTLEIGKKKDSENDDVHVADIDEESDNDEEQIRVAFSP